MRNDSSTQRPQFLALRNAAISAMAGRKWYEGPVGLGLEYYGPKPRPIIKGAYLDGVMDTLGGSHGPTFIYLPIVYLDDCQVAKVEVRYRVRDVAGYALTVAFL